MEKAIALLKFYRTILDFAHWNNKGYEDHLLYDRLRNQIDEKIDECVEKYLAFVDTVKYSNFIDTINLLMKEYQGFDKSDILELAKFCYDEIDNEDIRSMLSVHIYLLKK